MKQLKQLTIKEIENAIEGCSVRLKNSDGFVYMYVEGTNDKYTCENNKYLVVWMKEYIELETEREGIKEELELNVDYLKAHTTFKAQSVESGIFLLLVPVTRENKDGYTITNQIIPDSRSAKIQILSRNRNDIKTKNIIIKTMKFLVESKDIIKNLWLKQDYSAIQFLLKTQGGLYEWRRN